MSPARSRSDGLGMVSEGFELPLDQLPPIDTNHIKILPMCWKNPVTGKLALQIHPSAIRAIHLPGGSKMTDLEEGVIHSVVGAFGPDEKRLFRQCNLASSEGVMGPDGKLYE
ncbi:hypothetical protein PF005_g23044 [Phytophthora fragariae]|uniref:Uncharacterized protein n=1 Tax=Phytophthora fragariae TaxID=53985 RepID=A0A6A3E2Y3_9STRA|nr:hypothetical protein PF009_g23717 [Phytophthora fragariae]KAE9080100.1 hypothetical protein PF007_g23178 [Phytophthora fragariae]KAE9103449.1 hypothetical protein PF006_g22177 [Phytophthora fragariae]KAE9181016.1 hypothetical protein PF005_g23044 [Phytophthora fragariae]KAE9190523.1 hypothetical protein PF004_g21881 [Phytophthora fragariae]